MLRNEVDKLHIELTNTRSAHIAFDKVLQDKCELQTQVSSWSVIVVILIDFNWYVDP